MVKSIRLNEPQRELVMEEAADFAAKVKGEKLKEAYQRIGTEAQQGMIPDQLVPVLGNLLGVGLASGRIRSIHGAHAEMEAVKLFHQTPPGRALRRESTQLNEMFKCLAGQPIQNLSVSVRGPGLFTFTIQTDETRIAISFSQAGIDVRSVEVSF